MSKKVLQIYEIGQELPTEDDGFVNVDLTRYKSKYKIEREIPHGLTDVELAIWKHKNKKK